MLEHCNFSLFLRFEVTLWSYKVYDSAIELPDQKILRNKKYNALAHILPDIGKVTCLTLKNVRDLDVGGHALVVQGL